VCRASTGQDKFSKASLLKGRGAEKAQALFGFTHSPTHVRFGLTHCTFSSPRLW
jgi:hypothetical protein